MISLLPLFSLLFSIQFQIGQTGWDADELNGRVRQLRVTTRRVSFGKGIKTNADPIHEAVSEYDRHGRIVEQRKYENGRQFNKYTFSYNDDGRLREVVQVSFGGLVSKRVYQYKENGEKIDQAYEGDRPTGVVIIERFDNGRLIERISRDPNSWVIRTLHFYDRDGYETRVEHYVDKELISSAATFYDEKKRVQLCENYDPNGTTVGRSLFSYDGQGTLNRRVYYEASYVPASIDLYDLHGNNTSSSDYDRTGRVVRKRVFQYQYDHLGNWIKQTATTHSAKKNGVLELDGEETIVRTIAHY